MDFSVKTFYYTQLEGSIAYGCLRILISPDESKRQHCGRLSYDSVVVGDSKGQIHYYELRDSSLIEKAKTDPMSKGCARLEKLTRGGKISDKIMTAFGSMVAAYNVEGKQYFSFDSNLAEVLKWVVAEENKYVFACGEFMLNFYTINEGNIDDTYQYICPSEILDQYADSYDGMGYYVMLLCKDKKLRMINERGVVYETKLDHNAHSCYPFDENAYNFTNKKASGTRQMLLGMSNGEIRCYSVTQFEAKQLWSINASQMKSKSEAVLIRMFRLSGGSKCDIVVARADGNLEFYAQKDQPGQFELIAQTSINDTVTGLEGSVFNGTPVLMASTFSGKLVGVTLKNEYRGMEDVVATDGAKAEKERKISQLKKEIEELEKRVEAAKRTKQLEGGATNEYVDNKLSYTLKKAEGGGNKYEVSISSQENFRSIVLKKAHSTQVTLADNMPGIITPNPEEYLVSDLDFLTIDFSKTSASVFKMTIEPAEGMSCEPTVIVSPEGGESFAQALRIPIKPLSSHEKVSECPENLNFNNLKVKGSFDINLMNNWLFNILGDISVNVMDEQLNYIYYSKTTDSYLKIDLKAGILVVESESIIALAIIKDTLSSTAQESSSSLSFDWHLETSTIRKLLEKVAAEYNSFKDLETQYKLIEPIEEIAQLESDEIKISNKYKRILFNKDSITAKYKTLPKDVLHYRGLVVDLARCYFQLKGYRGSDKLAAVEAAVKQVTESYEQKFSAATFFTLITE